MNSRKFSELEMVLLKITDYMNNQSHDGTLREGALSNAATIDVPRGILRSRLMELESAGYLDRKIDTYPQGSTIKPEVYWIMTSKGVDFCNNTETENPALIPAADRFVSFDDNTKGLQEAQLALTELSEAIRGANGLFANHDERILVSQEINYIKEIISNPNVHLSALWDATNNNTTLQFLAKQTFVVVVRELAARVISQLHWLIQYFLK
jgi:DNA-binding HxlR family transcriptional regulator